MLDTHCHLDWPVFAGARHRLLKQAAAVGVRTIIDPGVSLATSKVAIELAERYKNVYAAVGIHPTENQTEITFEDLSQLEELAQHPRVVAIGEVGLDYYHLHKHPKETPPAARQVWLFEQFVMMAERVGKPLIVHAREAQREALDIIQTTVQHQPGFVFHSFDGDAVLVKELVAAGAYIGLNNMIGYPKNESLRAAVRAIPLERILLETDAPFLPPFDRRGTDAVPADTARVAEVVADCLDVPLALVDRVTSSNAAQLFGIESFM